MIGTTLAHYEIAAHLGSGGMGDVYQATDLKLGRSVAVKFLPEAFARDSERLARFEREARVLASLNHPTDGTVKVLDFGLAKALDEPKGSSPQGLESSPTITSPAMTMRGVILGTAAYMSPEQARGKIVDKRTDIFAFGCVLFEMLTGRRDSRLQPLPPTRSRT